MTRAENEAHLEDGEEDVWVCGLDEEQLWCKEGKCGYCEMVCYYISENTDLVKKSAKKICPVCTLEET